MPRFGDFETIREIGRGPRGVVFAASHVSGSERFAVKVLGPYFADRAAPTPGELDSFLASAQLQRELTEVSAGVWAPVHEAGRGESSAWYATDLFDRSVEKIIAQRRVLSARELRHVASSVLRALVELRDSYGRGHGRLNTRNVLVGGRGDLSAARVCVCDPAPPGSADANATDDLRNVGEIVRGLVTAGAPGPLEFSAPWSRLGADAEAWFSWCRAALSGAATWSASEALAALPGGATPAVRGARWTPTPGPADGAAMGGAHRSTVTAQFTPTVAENESPESPGAANYPRGADEGIYIPKPPLATSGKWIAISTAGLLVLVLAAALASKTWLGGPGGSTTIATNRPTRGPAPSGPVPRVEPTPPNPAPGTRESDPPSIPAGPDGGAPPATRDETTPTASAQGPKEPDSARTGSDADLRAHARQLDEATEFLANRGSKSPLQAEADGAIVRSLGELQRLLESGSLPREAFSETETIATRFGAVRASPEFERIAKDDPRAIFVVGRMKALAEIDALTAVPAVHERLTSAARKQQVGVVRQAWSRLLRLEAWPGSARDLRDAVEWRDQALRAFGAVGSSGDGARFAFEVRASMPGLWDRALRATEIHDPMYERGDEGAAEILALADECGVTPDRVPGATRFNVALARLRREVRAITTDTDETPVRGAVGRFLEAVGGLDPATRSIPDVDAAIRRARDIAQAPAPGPAPIDLGSLGPARRGWRVRPVRTDGMDGVVYDGPYGMRAEFVRVETPAGTAFVSTTEMAVGLFIDIVESSGTWNQTMPLLAPESSRRGPQVWTAPRGVSGKIEVARPVERNLSNGWLVIQPKLQGVELYPPGMVVAAPSPAHPVQYIPARAAVYVASLVGCRLPSVDEWRAALSLERTAEGAGSSRGADNRRDETWALAYRRAVDNAASGAATPDTDCFDAGQRTGEGEAVAGVGNDGLLWFAPIDQGGGARFHHLVGNVAEMVTREPIAVGVDQLTPDSATIIAQSDGQVLVIGASALTGPGIEPETAYSMGRRSPESAVFADVGFRLAFGPEKPRIESLASRTLHEVESLSLLPRP